jgi:hypothetical protein
MTTGGLFVSGSFFDTTLKQALMLPSCFLAMADAIYFVITIYRIAKSLLIKPMHSPLLIIIEGSLNHNNSDFLLLQTTHK